MSDELHVKEALVRRSTPAPIGRARVGGPTAADLVAAIERERPGLAEARGFSSAALRAGDLIRSMRKVAGLSQEQLAERMQLSQSRISELEAGSGSQGPTWDVMERVAAACGSRVGCFVDEAASSAGGTRLVYDFFIAAGIDAGRMRMIEVDHQLCLTLDVPTDEAGSAMLSVRLGPLATACG